MTKFKIANDFTIPTTLGVLAGTNVSDLYRNYRFTVIMKNKGPNTVTVNWLDVNNSTTQNVYNLAVGDIISEDFVPWEAIAGGIQAQAQIGNTTLFLDIYSTELTRLYPEYKIDEKTGLPILIPPLPALSLPETPPKEEDPPIPVFYKEVTVN